MWIQFGLHTGCVFVSDQISIEDKISPEWYAWLVFTAIHVSFSLPSKLNDIETSCQSWLIGQALIFKVMFNNQLPTVLS